MESNLETGVDSAVSDDDRVMGFTRQKRHWMQQPDNHSRNSLHLEAVRDYRPPRLDSHISKATWQTSVSLGARGSAVNVPSFPWSELWMTTGWLMNHPLTDQPQMGDFPTAERSRQLHNTMGSAFCTLARVRGRDARFSGFEHPEARCTTSSQSAVSPWAIRHADIGAQTAWLLRERAREASIVFWSGRGKPGIH